MAHTPKRTSRLIFDERPLLIPPSLAVAIGLNEAVFVQQLHYWLQESTAGRTEHGRRWIYNTYDDWLKQFPFWAIATLRRVIGGLEKDGIVLSTQEFNEHPADRTKWYSLDYDAIDAIESRLSKSTGHVIKMISPSDQSEQMGLINVISSTTKQKTSHKRESHANEIDPRLVELYARDYALEFHDDRPLDDRIAAMVEIWRRADCSQIEFRSAVQRARTLTKRVTSKNATNKMTRFIRELERALASGNHRP